jgi:hypothetical protein
MFASEWVRRIVAAAAVGLLFGMVNAAATAPAALASSPLSCTGTETVTFSPPLTFASTLTQVHFAIDLDNCPTGGVTAGESHGDFAIMTSCTTLSLLPPAFTDTYSWNTGQFSAVTYTAPVETVVNGLLVVTDTGTVTGGLDQGAVANETTNLPQLSLLACLTTGVAQLRGPYALTFA